MVIYDEKKQILYIPSAGDKIIYDDYEEKIQEAYQSGYTSGFEQGAADADHECNPPRDYSKEYLTIEVISGGTMSNKQSNGGYYRINGGEWIRTRNSAETIELNPGDKVEFKDGDVLAFPVPGYFSGRTMPEEYIVYGNLLSLAWGDDFVGKTTFRAAPGFNSTFEGCTGLTDASNLIISSYVSPYAGGCYDGMFRGCTNLQHGPALPATKVENYCYRAMFQDCTSLVEAPELPATVLGTGCYDNMFLRCTSLVSAPELPATVLANYCYAGMFGNCTSLVNAPILPATEMTIWCYEGMFYNCTSLTTAPYLGATVLANNCYADMFRGCSSLVNVQDVLPATNLVDDCYLAMFRNCTSLVKAPELPSTMPSITYNHHPYSHMFENCTSLNYVKCMLTNGEEEPIYLGESWIAGASEGTFVKHPDAVWRLNSGGGIPWGWTVIDAE